MTKIPYLPLYDFASRPLKVETLRAQHVASQRRAAGAQNRWQSAAGALRSDVLTAVKASQDNKLARSITAWTGEGSAFLPRTYAAPEMPSDVTRTGALGLIGTAVVYTAGQTVPVVGLGVVGLACEIAALVGLGVRAAMAGVAAVGAGIFGLLHGARQLFAWDARVTTLHQPFDDTVQTMQPFYDDFFGSSQNKPWPPKWQMLAGLSVHPQFVPDCTRSPHTFVSRIPENEGIGMSVALTESHEDDEPRSETQDSQQQIAVRNLLDVCQGDRAWASHATCVLTQSLGNVLYATLAAHPMVFQGGKPASLIAPSEQRHFVTRRNNETLVVNGAFDWHKGATLLGNDGRLIESGTSSPLWYKYRLAIQRPHDIAQALQAKLEHAEWGMGLETRYSDD